MRKWHWKLVLNFLLINLFFRSKKSQGDSSSSSATCYSSSCSSTSSLSWKRPKESTRRHPETRFEFNWTTMKRTVTMATAASRRPWITVALVKSRKPTLTTTTRAASHRHWTIRFRAWHLKSKSLTRLLWIIIIIKKDCRAENIAETWPSWGESRNRVQLKPY